MANAGTSIVDTESLDDVAEMLAKARKSKRWNQEIKFYSTKAEKWEEKAKKILRRYKDDRSPREQKVPRYNILWSNIQTLWPALYSRKPKPDIERRFRDKDDLGRYSSMVLERSISYFMNEEFDTAVRQAVFDRLLPGRGTLWVRYEPHFKDADENESVEDEGEEITDNVESYSQSKSNSADKPDMEDEAEAVEEVDNEDICWDYVHWQDFGHTFGRTWQEVDAVWRKVYLTRKELIARFGEDIGEKVTLDYSPHDLKDNKYDEVEKKATVYEIWCKSDKKVYWVHKDYQLGPLDEQDDPLGLTDFFPCPMPLYATLANDDLIPVPDYLEYQDQANELDEITSRLGSIIKAVKVVGVYDSSAQGVDRLLAEGVENQLVPISQWAVFGEKGGLKGVMDFLPLETVLTALQGLYEAREKVKADLYEITGIADIIRGATNANETATAQQIKSQFGTLRLSASQDDVQRFVRDLVKIGTEVIAYHFGIDTIKKICGVQLLTDQEKQLIQQRMQMLQAYQQQSQQMQKQLPPPGQQPQQPQLPPPQLPPLPPELQKLDAEDTQELLENPSWEEVEKLLHEQVTLAYKIDIETDSTIKFDQDAERDARVQFLESVGKFLQSAMAVQNPDLEPLMAKMLMFGVRGFKVGKELESAFEQTIAKLEKDSQDPSKKKPNPEMMKIQGEQQIAQQKMQMDMQMKQAEVQADLQVQQAKSAAEDKRLQLQAQVDAHQGQVDAQVEQSKITMQGQLDMAKAKLDSETKIAVAQIQAKASLKQTAMGKGLDPLSSEDPSLAHVDFGDGQKGPTIADLISTVVQQLQVTLGGIQQSHAGMMQANQQLAQAIAKPKQIIRDEQGNIAAIH